MKISFLLTTVLFIYKTGISQEPLGVISANGYFSAGRIESSLNFSTWTSPDNFSKRLTILQSNGYVGMGIESPTERLHVAGKIISTDNYYSHGQIMARQDFVSKSGVFKAENSLFKVESTQGFSVEPGGGSNFNILLNGNVGIGLLPADIKHTLHVAGNIQSNNAVIANSIDLMGGILKSPSQIMRFETPESFEFNTSGTNKNFTFAGGNLLVKKSIFIDETLGIKTNSLPGFDLAVRGKIVAKDLQIKPEKAGIPWPDYVFESMYELPSLSNVQEFIAKNKHLEGMPSAKQIEEEGYSTIEVTITLLKKVEELTLYIIQQQKEIDELKKQVDKDNGQQ